MRRMPFAVLVATVLSFLFAMPPALATHRAGATYTGPIEGGGVVSFKVSSGGSSVTSFSMYWVTADFCTALSVTQTRTGGYDITNHRFSSSGTFSFSGSFSSSRSAGGTLRYDDGGAGCGDTGTRDWTAFTTTACGPADFDRNGYADLPIGVPSENAGSIVDAGAVNVLYGASGGLSDAGDQYWSQNESGVADGAEAGDKFGLALAAGDFDRDGYTDLAIGVPFEDVGSRADAGAVNVLYGSSSGLTSSGDQLWYQDSSGVEDASEAGDRFGWSLAAGDFDVDGYCDLAIGVPNEDIGDVADAGAVNVLYGRSTGLSATGDQFWSQNTPAVLDAAEAGDQYGYALAAGGFNDPQLQSLAVGAPFEDVGSIADAGAVGTLFGDNFDGLTTLDNQLWTQNSSGILEDSESGDAFGRALACGDFDGDGYCDLAAGAPGEDVGSVADAGAVNVLYGAFEGLTSSGDQVWTQNSSGVQDAAETGDGFGASLVASRFNSDSRRDLAIGVPTEDVGSVVDAGAVHVLYGASSSGLSSSSAQYWNQNVSGIKGTTETGDRFGSALGCGTYNGDALCDLAIGVPTESAGSLANAGATHVLYAASGGVSSSDQYWTQDSSGIKNVAEAGDRFGSALG